MGIAAEINQTKFHRPPACQVLSCRLARSTSRSSRCRSCATWPGIDILGFLPGDLHMVTVFVAGVETASQNADAAKAFITFFQSPQAKALFRAKGLDPA